MSQKIGLVLVAFSLANAGCCYTGNVWGGWDMYTNGIRNLGSEPVRGNDWMVLNYRIKGWAAKAWQEVKASGPADHPYSGDYEKGFLEGFRDYIESGGSGLPPAVPTLCYRRWWFRSPPGQQAIEDWYAGFHRGAQTARASGLRDLIVVPISCGVPGVRTTEPSYGAPVIAGP